VVNTVLAVVVYEVLVALVFVTCWRLVRRIDTRLPIAAAGDGGARADHVGSASGSGRQSLGLHWQIFTFLLSAAVMALVALSTTGWLADLRATLNASQATEMSAIPPMALRLALPVGHMVVLLVLYQRLRKSVLFPTVAVHLFLVVFCLLVTAIDPARITPNRLTLVPIFVTNLVLLVVTHGLLTLLFCRSKRELVGAVLMAAVAGGVLALGTMVIAVVSTLTAGPLFFFQLYLVSAFGIFGLYFCAASIFLSVGVRD
jgi:hypothetical protein